MARPAQLSPKVSRSAPKQQADDDGVLKTLGHGTLSTIGAIGNFLDIPGSMVRDVLVGQNPLDNLASPLSSDNRVSGRDVLQKAGLVGVNRKGLDASDIAGFVGEVALDPLTYLSFGASALGKGGKVVKAAGGIPKNLSRVGRMTTEVAPAALRAAPDALANAAKRKGYSSTDAFLAARGSEKLGGLVGVGIPFKSPSFTVGTGRVAQKIGSALDKIGDIASYGKIPGTQFSPGRQVARVFSSDAMGLHTPGVAKRAQDLPGKREAIITGHRAATAKDVSELARHGALDDETSMFGRAYGEDVLDISKLPAEQQAKARLAAKITDPWKQKLDESFIEARTLGIRVERHGDPSGGGYLPRFFVEKLNNSANTMGREDYLVGIKGMTEQLRKAIADPKVLEGEFDDAVDYVRETYPAVVELPQAEVMRQGGEAVGASIDQEKWQRGIAQASRNAEDLVHHIRHVYTTEQRAVGGFGRNWLADIQDAQIGMDWKATRAETMLDILKDVAKPTREITAQGETRTVGEVLEAAGLDPVANVNRPHPVSGTNEEVREGALLYLARALDMAPYDDATLTALAARRLPAAEADDLVRLMKGDDIKNVVGPLVQMFDAASNFFKVSVLNWPSRYSRDFTSSQAMNILTGNYDQGAFNQLHKMVAGGTGDFTDIPIVQQMLAEQGLEATAENSTEIMRQLFYTYEKHTAVAGTHGTSEIVGELSGNLPGGTKGFAAEFPGRDPLSPLSPSTLNSGAPARSLAAWNPLNVRGIGGRLTSGAKPVAIGERLGRYTDTMGRGTAFIANLKKGVAPEEASRIADAIQVNYKPRSFTAAERKYLKRAFPFYSFVSRMLPEVAKQLLERPGGGIGQAIRAQNELRSDDDGPIPEHVSKGLAINLGETPTGDQRYLTAMDLMHEAPLNVAQFKNGAPDLPGTLRNVGSMLNPYIKGVAELSFGKTLFQNRELEDSDPTIGRLLTNVGLRDEAMSGRAKPFINTTFEQVVANSPAARLFSSLRTATDPRKGIGAKALNLGTGARITDVSPRVQRGILIDRLSELMKSRGASEMSTIRFRKAEIEAVEKSGDKSGADTMRMLNREANKLLADAKKSAEQARKKIKPAR